MKIAVRYYSQSGKTEKIARPIAAGAGVEALSVTQAPVLDEAVDVLFLGGAPYANIMAPQLRSYAEALNKDCVRQVVLFTTANWSHRTILALKKLLRKKSIAVAEETFFAQAARIDSRISDAEAFGRNVLERDGVQ